MSKKLDRPVYFLMTGKEPPDYTEADFAHVLYHSKQLNAYFVRLISWKQISKEEAARLMQDVK